MILMEVNNNQMAPFFPFYGSKWRLARSFPRPSCDTVIEPFAGSAGYSTYYDCTDVVLVDVDPIVAGVWTYLIGAAESDIMSLPELPNAGDSVDDHCLVDGAKWLIGFWLNRGSATPKKSRTLYSARSDRSQLNWGLRAKERIASQLHGIRRWKVVLGDYTKSPEADATWFVDPPYVDKGKYYRFHDVDYKKLSTWCLGRHGQTIVCEGARADWLPFRVAGDFKTSKGRSEERVYIQEKVRLVHQDARRV